MRALLLSMVVLCVAACAAPSPPGTIAAGVPRVLTERDFLRIVPDVWTRADVERELGPPASVDAVASWDGPILTYRWRDVQRAPMFYWVYLDRQGVVRRAHPGMEFRDRIFNGRF